MNYELIYIDKYRYKVYDNHSKKLINQKEAIDMTIRYRMFYCSRCFVVLMI